MKNLIFTTMLLTSFNYAQDCKIISGSFKPYNPGIEYNTYGVFGSLFDGDTDRIEVISNSKVLVTFHAGEYWDASTSEYKCEKTKEELIICESKEQLDDSFFLEKLKMDTKLIATQVTTLGRLLFLSSLNVNKRDQRLKS